MPRGPMRNLLLGLLLLLALALTTVVLGLPNQLGDGIARELLEVFLIGGFACCMVLGWLGWRQGRDLSRAEHAGQRSWQMLETVPEALLVLDPKTGRVLSANNRCRTVFGREPESLKSLPLDALLPSLELPAGTDETPAPHAVELRETEALQADGTHLPVDIGVSQFVAAPTDALQTIISIRDARPRLAAESGRLDAERRTRQIIQSVPGVVYRCAMDEQWTMAFVSDQVEELTGYPADDFIGNRRTSFGALIHPDDAVDLQSKVEGAALAGLPWLVEYRIRHRDGELRWVMEHGSAQQAADGRIVWLYGVMMDVTDLKNAERTAAETSQRLVEITENLPGATWRAEIHQETGIARFTHFAGKLDTPFGDLDLPMIRQDAGQLLTLVHPDDRDRYRRDIEQALADGRYSSEYRIRRRGSRWGWVRATGSIYDVKGSQYRIAVGHTVDIDAERQLTEKLETARTEAEAQAERLSRLTANLPGVVWELRMTPPDFTLRYTYISDTPHIVIDLKPEQFYREFDQVLSFVHPDDQPTFTAQVERLRHATDEQDLTGTFQYRMRAPDDSYFWRRTAFRGAFNPDGSRTVYGLTIDIQREKTLEQALRSAREEADSANAAKSEFLANMSHEIRTPMNAVVGMSQLMRGTDLTGQQGRYLSQIESSSRLLLRLLDDILDLSKIEARHLDIETIPFELHQLIDDVGNLMGERSRDKQLELSIRLADDCPNRLIGDPLRIRQVLGNLASNAIKFTPDGGDIDMTIDTVWRNQQQARLRFAVTDSGIGLTPEQQTRIFEAFEQADASTTRQFGGTGLGLTIARRLVTLMGGTMGVSSSPDAGSRFWFELVLDEDHTRQPDAALVDLSGRRALVVDDHPTTCEVITGLLARLGVTAVSEQRCRSGLARLEAAVKQSRPYDFLIVDWRMPELSGTELVRRVLNAPERYGRPRTVMMTGYGAEHSLPGIAELKLDGFLVKPVSPSRLLATLTQAVQSQDPEPPEAPQGRPLSLSGVHVLVVEDNAINQEIASTVLRQAGANVSLAEHGAQALERLEAGDGIDLILMDCQMPVMDGFEASRRIRGLDAYRDTPIVAMTANAMDGDRERCLNAGMDDYMAKPIESETLLETVGRHLGRVLASSPTHGVVPTDLPDLPGFALGDALRRLDGNRGVLLSLLKRFRTDHCDATAAIRHALDADNPAGAKLHAHSLKGAASSLGAYPLAAQAAAVEAAIDNNAPVAAPLAELGEQLSVVRQALDSIEPLPATAPTKMSADSFKRQWRRLAQLLLENDTRAVDLASTLRQLVPAGLEQAVSAVIDRAEAYDFVGAKQAMDQVDLGENDAP